MQLTPTFTRKLHLSPTLLLLVLAFAAVALLACNPFGGDDEAGAAESFPELVEVSLDPSEAVPGDAASSDQQSPAGDAPETPSEPPAEAPSEPAAQEPVPAAEEPPAEGAAPSVVSGTAEEARNLAWAFLSQCVDLSLGDLEAVEIQGEWFVQATGGSPEKYGLWKVDPAVGLVQSHNIRARQWEPLINQNCTPEGFTGFFTPTPSPLLDANITEAEQAVTTLWATLVNCYPNMRTTDLEATLNQAEGEWVITTRPEVNTNYGVWAVASDGKILPQNRQAQGVFDQLGTGLC